MAVAAGVATAPPTACHEILCHTMGCRGDAMVCHGCYHGHATQNDSVPGSVESYPSGPIISDKINDKR